MARRPGMDVSEVTARVNELAAEGYEAETIASVVAAQAPVSTLKNLAHLWLLDAASAAGRARAREIERAQAEEFLRKQREQREAEQARRQSPEYQMELAARNVELRRQRAAQLAPVVAGLRAELGESPELREVAELVAASYRDAMYNKRKAALTRRDAAVQLARELVPTFPEQSPKDFYARDFWHTAANPASHDYEIKHSAASWAHSVSMAEAMERFVQETVEERGYGAAMRFTQAFLATEFALGDGRKVTWGEATVEHHEVRIEMMKGKAAGILEDVVLHEQVRRTLIEAGVKCLNELPEEA